MSQQRVGWEEGCQDIRAGGWNEGWGEFGAARPPMDVPAALASPTGRKAAAAENGQEPTTTGLGVEFGTWRQDEQERNDHITAHHGHKLVWADCMGGICVTSKRNRHRRRSQTTHTLGPW